MVYSLIVSIKLRSAEDVGTFFEHFNPLRKYCNESEPETLVYDAFIEETSTVPAAAEKDDAPEPTTPQQPVIVIVERYVSKESLTEVHHKSEPFVEFRTWLGGSDIMVGKNRLCGYSAEEN